MKIMKKVLTVGLSLLMGLSVIPVSDVHAETEVEKYSVGDNVTAIARTYNAGEPMEYTEITLSGSGKMRDFASEYNSPFANYSRHNGYGSPKYEHITKIIVAKDSHITYIGDNTFYKCDELTEISFPDCKEVGAYAFYGCNRISSINFPVCSTVKAHAFRECSSLKALSFPQCKIVEQGAFNDCASMVTMSFPKCEYVKGGLHDGAFEACSLLTEVDIPNCCTLGEYAFAYCENLTSIYLPKCIVLGDSAFASCFSLKSATIKKGCTYKTGYRPTFGDCPLLKKITYVSGPVEVAVKAPAKVKGVKATKAKGKKQTVISWTKISNADGYRIYISKNGGKSYSTLATISKNAKNALYKKYNKNWKYKVRAYVKDGNKKVFGKTSSAVKTK